MLVVNRTAASGANPKRPEISTVLRVSEQK